MCVRVRVCLVCVCIGEACPENGRRCSNGSEEGRNLDCGPSFSKQEAEEEEEKEEEEEG